MGKLVTPDFPQLGPMINLHHVHCNTEQQPLDTLSWAGQSFLRWECLTPPVFARAAALHPRIPELRYLVLIMPDELRHTAELLRALEFTREKVDNVISEARRRGCLFYRFDRDRSNGIVSLRLKNLDGVSFRRMLNCNSFFKSSGGYSESEASRILAEVDALFTASGDFKVYPPVVRNHRRGRRPRRDKV